MHYMEKIIQILKTFGLLRKDDPFCRVTPIPLGAAGVNNIMKKCSVSASDMVTTEILLHGRAVPFTFA